MQADIFGNVAGQYDFLDFSLDSHKNKFISAACLRNIGESRRVFKSQKSDLTVS